MSSKFEHNPSWILATVRILRGRWFVEFTQDSVKHCLTVTHQDAWNFDIERGLQVWVWLDKGQARIARKGKMNKRYVTI